MLLCSTHYTGERLAIRHLVTIAECRIICALTHCAIHASSTQRPVSLQVATATGHTYSISSRRPWACTTHFSMPVEIVASVPTLRATICTNQYSILAGSDCVWEARVEQWHVGTLSDTTQFRLVSWLERMYERTVLVKSKSNFDIYAALLIVGRFVWKFSTF